MVPQESTSDTAAQSGTSSWSRRCRSIFRRICKHAGSTFKYEPYWDILSAIDGLDTPPSVYPGWAAFGVTGLTDRMMEERLDTYMESLIYRVAFK